MEEMGRRLGFAILALPIFLLVHWLELDERFFHAGVGVLMAFMLIGQNEEDPKPVARIVYPLLACAGLLGSILAAFLVRHLSDDPVGLYELAAITSDWKVVRALPLFPVALASFSLVMFLVWASSPRGKSDAGDA